MYNGWIKFIFLGCLAYVMYNNYTASNPAPTTIIPQTQNTAHQQTQLAKARLVKLILQYIKDNKITFNYLDPEKNNANGFITTLLNQALSSGIGGSMGEKILLKMDLERLDEIWANLQSAKLSYQILDYKPGTKTNIKAYCGCKVSYNLDSKNYSTIIEDMAFPKPIILGMNKDSSKQFKFYKNYNIEDKEVTASTLLLTDVGTKAPINKHFFKYFISSLQQGRYILCGDKVELAIKSYNINGDKLADFTTTVTIGSASPFLLNKSLGEVRYGDLITAIGRPTDIFSDINNRVNSIISERLKNNKPQLFEISLINNIKS